MQVHLSFDHELFFGSDTGSVEKCILEPTEQLLKLSRKHKVPFIFFVDAGYLVQLKNCNESKCRSDLQKISSQLKTLVGEGHQIGLHVHPHWEDCFFENGKWKIDTKRYKLSDFSKEEAANILFKYQNTLSEISGTKITAYRAGGWCIQPFAHIKEALKKIGITVDSSVYVNGYHESPAHAYDFRTAKDKAEWNFENDCCVEEPSGSFKEISITPDTIGPAFYWNLYFKMKSAPEKYKPIGDGMWLKDKARIYKQFHSSTDHFACADGYFSSRLEQNLIRCEKKNFSRMMVLSHPKSLAPCSFEYLDEFISFAKQRGHQITTIH
jgi:peptidoglycan/xylan/chitin deacetylase (PgdA/CDA1 family)